MRQIMAAMRGRPNKQKFSASNVQQMEIRGGKTSALTSVSKDNLVIEFLIEKLWKRK